MINLNINKVNPQIDFYSTVDYETVRYRWLSTICKEWMIDG